MPYLLLSLKLMNIFFWILFFRMVLIIDQKSQGAYIVLSAVIHTFGYVPTGVRQRPGGVRLANSLTLHDIFFFFFC